MSIDWRKESTEASREAKKLLTEWWGSPEVTRLKESMYDYDLEELDLIYKQLQLKMRNQQSSNVKKGEPQYGTHKEKG